MEIKILVMLLALLVILLLTLFISNVRRERIIKRVTLSGRYISITIAKKTNLLNKGKARIVIEEVRNLKTGYSWCLEKSPIWQVGLGKVGEIPQRYPSFAQIRAGMYFDDDKLQLEKNENRIILKWINIGLPNGSQTLSITVIIELDHREKLKWSIEASVSPGDNVIYYVNFPFLFFGKIGDSHEDDYLVFPQREGRLIKSPIEKGNKIPDDTRNLLSRSFFYPGEITTQFMAYYDGDSGEGFYIAAEDKNGNVKRVYFNSIDGLLYLYFTHFNFALPGPRDEVIKQLQYFSLRDKLNYTIATQVFVGDWIDAAMIYRKWVEEERPIFISKGKLKVRSDISERVKLTSIAILYRIRRPINESATLNENDPNSDFSRIKEMVDFFREKEHNLKVAVSIVGLEEFPGLEVGDLALGGDWGKGVMRNNSAELLDKLWKELEVITAFNRDTGHWILKCREDLREVINCDQIESDAIPKAIIKMENFEPPPWPAFKGKMTLSCLGSSYIIERIIKGVEDTITKSKVLSNGSIGYGFIVAELTGQGSVCYPCYAPFDMKTDLRYHNHPIGGGSWYIKAWRRLVEYLYSKYQKENPDFCILAEREHEHLIDNAIVLGKNNIYPFDSLGDLGFGGDVILSSNAQPIPLMTFLYHDYRLQVEAPSIFPHFLERYKEYVNDPIQLYYHITVSCIVWGRIPSVLLVSTDHPNLKQLGLILGTPSERPLVWRELLKYVREITEARAIGKEYLIFGQALRPPKVDCMKIKIPLVGADGKLQEYETPAIIASAWKSYEGNIGIILANYINKSVDTELEVDVKAYGLDKTSYSVYLLTKNGRETLGIFSTSPFTLKINVPARTIIIIEID